MKQHHIRAQSLIPHGQVEILSVDGSFLFTTTRSQNTHFDKASRPIKSWLAVPGRFHLPLKIDLTVGLDAPALYLLVGEGHVTFGSTWQDNRHLGDITGNDAKPRVFDNHLDFQRPSRLTLVYTLDQMAIFVDDVIRYHSRSEKYMRSKPGREVLAAGLELGIACEKFTQTSLESLRVTEFDSSDEIEILRSVAPLPAKEFPTSLDRSMKLAFETQIAHLEPVLRDAVTTLDRYLLGLRHLGIKRKVEGSPSAGKITYQSPMGFSYALFTGEHAISHYFWWYMVSNRSQGGQFMGRKADWTEATLAKVAETDPELAGWLYSRYAECVGCYQTCLARTSYAFAGQKKVSCHGRLWLDMNPAAFTRFISFMEALQAVLPGGAAATVRPAPIPRPSR